MKTIQHKRDFVQYGEEHQTKQNISQPTFDYNILKKQAVIQEINK